MNLTAIREAAEGRYEVDYEGWIMRGYANGERQAKYRAWKHFTKKYSVTFIQFMRIARACKMREYEDFGNITLWDGCGRKIEGGTKG